MNESKRLNEQLNLIEIDCVDTISPRDFKINYLDKYQIKHIKNFKNI